MRNTCGKRVNLQRIPASKTCVHTSAILLRASMPAITAWINAVIIHWIFRTICTTFPLRNNHGRPLEVSTFSTISTEPTIYHHQLNIIKG